MDLRHPRRLVCLTVLLSPLALLAQTPGPSAELQDALNQLKARQDRISEQATEIQKLRDRIAELEKTTPEPEVGLRAHYAAWQQFIDANPRIRAMWLAFFQTPAAAERARELLGDRQWPFSV